MDNLKLNTPEGIASYPHLTRPDSYQGKEAYKCKLILDASEEAVEAFRSKVEGYVAKAKEMHLAELEEKLQGMDPKAKNPKAKKQYDDTKAIYDDIVAGNYRSPLEDEWGDDDSLTGNIILTTKSNASFTATNRDGSKEVISLAPKLYDAQANLMKARPEIKGGSTLCLQVTLVPYLAPTASIGGGVSARINAVQIVKLSGGGSGDAGFAAKDGFTGSDYDFEPSDSDEGPEDTDEESMEY